MKLLISDGLVQRVRQDVNNTLTKHTASFHHKTIIRELITTDRAKELGLYLHQHGDQKVTFSNSKKVLTLKQFTQKRLVSTEALLNRDSLYNRIKVLHPSLFRLTDEENYLLDFFKVTWSIKPPGFEWMVSVISTLKQLGYLRQVSLIKELAISNAIASGANTMLKNLLFTYPGKVEFAANMFLHMDRHFRLQAILDKYENVSITTGVRTDKIKDKVLINLARSIKFSTTEKVMEKQQYVERYWDDSSFRTTYLARELHRSIQSFITPSNSAFIHEKLFDIVSPHAQEKLMLARGTLTSSDIQDNGYCHMSLGRLNRRGYPALAEHVHVIILLWLFYILFDMTFLRPKQCHCSLEKSEEGKKNKAKTLPVNNNSSRRNPIVKTKQSDSLSSTSPIYKGSIAKQKLNLNLNQENNPTKVELDKLYKPVYDYGQRIGRLYYFILHDIWTTKKTGLTSDLDLSRKKRKRNILYLATLKNILNSNDAVIIRIQSRKQSGFKYPSYDAKLNRKNLSEELHTLQMKFCMFFDSDDGADLVNYMSAESSQEYTDIRSSLDGMLTKLAIEPESISEMRTGFIAA